MRDALKQGQQEAGAEQLHRAAECAYVGANEMHAFGRVIVVATAAGELKFFENTGAPQWA